MTSEELCIAYVLCAEEVLAAYTPDSLASLLRLMGAKPRHSIKVSARVFAALEVLGQRESSGRALPPGLPRSVRDVCLDASARTATLPRSQLEALILWALALYQYAKPEQLVDLRLAASIHERKQAVILLLCGTSGTGKSTLAALLAARLGITTVLSTDSVRGVMRGMVSQETCPILFASTYQAGEHVQLPDEPGADEAAAERRRTVKGYKAQSELVLAHLEPLLADLLARGESAIVEGAHLSLNQVARLVARHRSIVPFLITISNEAKHRERFAVRARCMSLAPESNRYVRYFLQIRTIQEYLVGRAARHAIPCLNNTNVDRSVDVIHACTLGFVRREALGEAGGTDLLSEYVGLLTARGAWSSKAMLAVIRSRRQDRGAASDAERGVSVGAAPLPVPAAVPGPVVASSDDDQAGVFEAGCHSEGVGSALELEGDDGEEGAVRRLSRLEEETQQ